MSNGPHQLYLISCGCGHDLFALKSTLSVGMGVGVDVGVGVNVVTFLHLHLRVSHHLMSKGPHQLYKDDSSVGCRKVTPDARVTFV